MKTFSKSKAISIGLAVVALAVLAVVALSVAVSGDADTAAADAGRGASTGEIKSTRAKGGKNSPAAGKSAKSKPKPKISAAELYKDYSPADRRLAERLQALMDDEKPFELVREGALEALKSKNPELRIQAVESLGWFGERALVELTPLMADPDEDVAEAAVGAWELALNDLPTAGEKMSVSKMALEIIRDRDILTRIGGEFSGAALELVNGESNEAKATRYRVEAVQTILNMIESGRLSNESVGREIYEDISGHEWISVDEAEKYLADPENYEPPEEADDGDDVAEAAADANTEAAENESEESADTETAESEPEAAEDEPAAAEGEPTEGEPETTEAIEPAETEP